MAYVATKNSEVNLDMTFLKKFSKERVNYASETDNLRVIVSFILYNKRVSKIKCIPLCKAFRICYRHTFGYDFYS